MTDASDPAGQNPPAYGSQPPAPPAYPQAPQAYGAPPAVRPGRTLGIVALILSFFAALIGLILGIVALVQSRKAGEKNGFALAAIIISSIAIVLSIIATIIFFAVVLPQLAGAAEEVIRQCQTLGGGVQEIGGVTIDCDDILNP